MLVVDAKSFEAAGPWGDVLSFYAKRKGIAGLVIDGAVRDSLQIIEMGFPVFCRAICIKGTDKLNVGCVNEPITCGGVVVNPGDAIVGGADGVTVVPRSAVADACAVEEDTEVVLSPFVLSTERFEHLAARERRIARDILTQGRAL